MRACVRTRLCLFVSLRVCVCVFVVIGVVVIVVVIIIVANMEYNLCSNHELEMI